MEIRTRLKAIIRAKLWQAGLPPDQLEAEVERRYQVVMDMVVPNDDELRQLELTKR